MRPISFENLRRLVGRKKDRNEPSFKRSESFKRISIRKSYLDRGKRRNKVLQKVNDIKANQSQDVSNNEFIDELSKNVHENQTKTIISTKSIISERQTIAYDDWLNDVNSISKEKLYDSKICKNKGICDEFSSLRLDPESPISDVFSRSNYADAIDELPDDSLTLAEAGPPSVSVSLGRVWLDTVLMPFPSASTASSIQNDHKESDSVCSSQSCTLKSTHRSLDSVLNEKKLPQTTVARTVSAPVKKTSKNSKTFNSFSMSITKVKQFKSAKNGLNFFRKNTNKPIDDETVSDLEINGSNQKISSGKRKSTQSLSLIDDNANLGIDHENIGFVLPEKRKTKRVTKIWHEIRYYKDFDDSEEITSFEATPLLYESRKFECHLSGDEFFHSYKSSSSCSKSSIDSELHGPKISDFNEDKIFSEKFRGIMAQRPVWPSKASRLNSEENFFSTNYFKDFIKQEKKTPINYYRCLSSSESESDFHDFDDQTDVDDKPRIKKNQKFIDKRKSFKDKDKRNLHKRRQLPKQKYQQSQSQRQPVFLVRKCSSLRRRPSKINCLDEFTNRE